MENRPRGVSNKARVPSTAFPMHRPREDVVTGLRIRLAETTRKIERLIGAIAGGVEDVPSIRAVLVGLERERQVLETDLVDATAQTMGPAEIGASVDALIDSMSSVRDVLAAGDMEERRGLVRTFLRTIEIQKKARRAILSWYRLPGGDGVSVKLVAPTGRDRTYIIQVRDFIAR